MRVNPYEFIHENDRKAMEALKAVPGFDLFCKAFLKVFNERSEKILNMSSMVRLSEKQCPRIYNLLIPICEKLGIPIPELYLCLDRNPNAYASGDTVVFIKVTSGLLELCTDEEIQTILAHECGHIVCHHVLYHTMGNMVINGSAALLGLGPVINTALKVAFFYWIRCSEFSADRVAAAFCGGPERVSEVMLRLAGASKEMIDEISLDLFMEQAQGYEAYVNDSNWNKILETLVLMERTHPLLAVRAASISNWCREPVFADIVTALNTPDDKTHCPQCGTVLEGDWAFCGKCGAPLK